MKIGEMTVRQIAEICRKHYQKSDPCKGCPFLDLAGACDTANSAFVFEISDREIDKECEK